MHLVVSHSPRSRWHRAFALFAAAGLGLGLSIARGQPAHLVKGLQLADEIGAAQSQGLFSQNGTPLNRYGGSWGGASDPSFIRFADLPNGVLAANNTKCAPLVTHLLKNAYNWNWSLHSFYDPVLKTTKTSASPAPYQYIALLKAGKGFAAQITRLDQTLPGDILLWWNIGSADKDHAMIVVSVDLPHGKPYPSALPAARPELAGTTFFEVEVLDSSSGVHTRDSRIVSVNGVDTQIAGIGTGTVGILVNAQFEIVGTTWSLPTADFGSKPGDWLDGLHSRLKPQTATEAVIGRLP